MLQYSIIRNSQPGARGTLLHQLFYRSASKYQENLAKHHMIPYETVSVHEEMMAKSHGNFYNKSITNLSQYTFVDKSTSTRLL